MSQFTTYFSWPKEVIYGSHVSGEIGRYLKKENNIRHVMIITDEGILKNNLPDPLKNSLDQAGIEYKVCDQVQPEVPDTTIMEVLKECSKPKTDALIAVGGGSVIDTAKAVGILLANGGKIQDYEGFDKVPLALPNLYAVPTTSGSGAEASQFCICLDTKKKKKIEIFSRRNIPHRVFIDPLLTLSMPSDLSASCGMDALNHGIEAYFSTWASPLTDVLSLHAIRLISENLRGVSVNGKNIEARQNMALASFEAGLAFTNAHSGAVQALGQPIAGIFQIPQRISNGVLLPHVMRYNLRANMDRMVEVARAMGEPVEGLSKREAAEKAIFAVKALLVDIGLPTTLDKIGLKKEAILELSRQASKDLFMRTSPLVLTQQEISEIYENAFHEYVEPEFASSSFRHEVFH